MLITRVYINMFWRQAFCRYNGGMRTIRTLAVFGVAVFFLVPSALLAQNAGADASSTPTHKKAPVSVEEATDYSVRPVVTNEKAKPRDIIKKELTLENHTDRKYNIYIHVENVDPALGTTEFVSPGVSDLSTSLANWLEITRGVIELLPYETKTIPYLIHVNLSAKPGSYFARIRFGDGPSRDVAEEKDAGIALLLNLEVLDDAQERLNLGGFLTDHTVFTGTEAAFSYALENTGNRDITPRGSIRIFNRRGEEVGEVPVSSLAGSVQVGATKQLAGVWDATGRLGKYKAFLDLEYGNDQLATVQDTVYFWVLPWREILFMVIGVLVLAVLGTYLIHTRQMAVPVRVERPQGPDAAPATVPETAPSPRAKEPARAVGDTVRLTSRSRDVPSPPSPSRAASTPQGHVVQLTRRK